MPKNAELVAAYQILGGIPDKQIDLKDIVSRPGITVNGRPFCGTVACGVGWLLMHPRYTSRGFGVRNEYCSCVFKLPGSRKYKSVDYTRVAAAMLGIDMGTAYELFMPRGGMNRSAYDPRYEYGMTDKQLLLSRIRNYLKSPAPKMNPDNFRR